MSSRSDCPSCACSYECVPGVPLLPRPPSVFPSLARVGCLLPLPRTTTAYPAGLPVPAHRLPSQRVSAAYSRIDIPGVALHSSEAPTAAIGLAAPVSVPFRLTQRRSWRLSANVCHLCSVSIRALLTVCTCRVGQWVNDSHTSSSGGLMPRLHD
ncbi:hypothetical protein C8Q73DRAFT_365027 [Cubamyces lactineus]|nr:hypothetical protein C8Q73DRAFT_365027 [Cubamyces lactineus]